MLWLLVKVEKFPRSYRLTVGERLSVVSLDLLLRLVDASYSQHKREPLAAASTQVNAIRFLLRIARDLKLLPQAGHLYAAERLDEIGRLVGGWRRSAAVSS